MNIVEIELLVLGAIAAGGFGWERWQRWRRARRVRVVTSRVLDAGLQAKNRDLMSGVLTAEDRALIELREIRRKVEGTTVPAEQVEALDDAIGAFERRRVMAAGGRRQ